jgi:hypothetical protein
MFHASWDSITQRLEPQDDGLAGQSVNFESTRL